MKENIIFCLFGVIFCFCNCPKNHVNNSDVTMGGIIEISADTIIEISVAESREALPNEISGWVDDEFDRYMMKAAKTWALSMSDTVLSALSRFFSDNGNDEAPAIVYTIIKKEVDKIGESYNLTGEVNIEFRIIYRDDNYITAQFIGSIFCEGCVYPPRVLWPVMVDIKNETRLTLTDIVRIDDRFVELVFNELQRVFSEIGEGIDYVNNSYPVKKRKDILQEVDVFVENNYSPDIMSYFNANELVICFYVGKAFGQYRCIALPLSEILTMIILSDFPVDSDKYLNKEQ